jgi:hypothetical protein
MSTDSQTQVGNFLEKAQEAVGQAPAGTKAEPKVPFQTDLKLDGEQEKKMLEHAFKRLDELNQESGRNQTQNPTWWLNQSQAANSPLFASQGLLAADTWMGKRTRYDAMFLNDVSWRPWTMGPDNIFMSSNLSVPITRRVCRQMIARAKNMFFGYDSWFSVDPAPVSAHQQDEVDDERAEKIEAFCRFKMAEGDNKEDLGRAISRALILGECPVKTSYVVRDQIFNTEATVLHTINEGGQAEPVRGADGNYVTDQDEFVDKQDGTGRQVLKRDGQTPQPLAPIWNKIPLNRRQVLYEGTKTEPIFYKDFLCPITAKDVQTADTIVHLYDKPVMEFVDLIVKRGMISGDTQERLGAAQKMVALVTQLADNTSAPKALETQQLRPNENFMSPPTSETGGPIAEFAEFYMWYDANGDGVAENIMLIADRNSKMPIFYDHVANITTDGLRPIEIVRINPVEGRWYGLGIMELFEPYQLSIDLLINRWNFSQSRSGRVDLWDPTATLEGDRDPTLKMNWGGTYTKKPGKKKEDVLESVYLTDVKFEQIYKQAQYFQQLLMNESGVTNANDDQAAGLETSKLATGVLNVQESGDELFKPIVADLRGPLTKILDRSIDVTLANMNPVEVFTYLEGDTMGIDQLTPDEVRGLRFKTRIELTTMKNQQQLQLSAQAAALVEKFYMLPPAVQAKVEGFYRTQLRMVDPRADVDTVIEAMPNTPPAPPPPKVALSVVTKGENLSPVERQQIMGEMGVQETPKQAADAPPVATPASTPGQKPPDGNVKPKHSTTKLGEGGPKTPFKTQLTQVPLKSVA